MGYWPSPFFFLDSAFQCQHRAPAISPIPARIAGGTHQPLFPAGERITKHAATPRNAKQMSALAMRAKKYLFMRFAADSNLDYVLWDGAINAFLGALLALVET